MGGITLTIRKFQYMRFGIEDLLNAGSLTGPQVTALREAVAEPPQHSHLRRDGKRQNHIANALASLIPPHQRMILIEDVNEIAY